MTKTVVLWVLGLIGWIASYVMFGLWLDANGWDLVGGWVEAFTVSDFATGLLFDLVATTFMMVAVAIFERDRLGPRWTAAVVGTLALSVSVSLAVYLVGRWRSERSGAT
ncbi:MAG: DUF2834 domain-containing protein [Myxococcota bacterium]|jgi:hypothetical protein|nr:DUF2834 domain-containing protein [Myxococcota bacterium]